jgi:hypothetical protein
VRIKQHFVTLSGIGRQEECAAGTQLGMRRNDFALNTAYDQQFFAPVVLARSEN